MGDIDLAVEEIEKKSQEVISHTDYLLTKESLSLDISTLHVHVYTQYRVSCCSIGSGSDQSRKYHIKPGL